MEQFLKVAGLVIGIIAGLLGLLKTILEIRKQVREDKSLPTLVAGPQFRIGAILAFIGLAVLIGSVRNSIATQLAHYLSANPRLSITDPDRLAVLKEEIAVNEAILAQNPMVQQTLRTSLGLDLIVTGVYEGP